MDRVQQLAALRRELYDQFPGCQLPGPSLLPVYSGYQGWKSGVPELDQLLHGIGLPCGRISELTGAASSGKSSLTCKLLTSLTRSGNPIAYIDPSRSFYPPSAAFAGVDLARLLLIRVPTISQGFKAADILLRGQAFPLIVFDWSFDPETSDADFELGSAVARLNGLCSLGSSILLFITSPRTAHDPLRFYATLRLEVRRQQATPQITSSRPLRLVGISTESAEERIVLQVVKNKLGPPGGSIQLQLDPRGSFSHPLHPGIG